jgi:AmmeMemoRadiSam system protein B/AmmeMemoRadiSam system protein A
MSRVLFTRLRLAAAALLSAASLGATGVREPAVAGLFYPRDSAELSRQVDGLLAQARSERTGTLKALICPHAGYAYSGPVAATAFKLVEGQHFRTVVILGPAHYAALDVASVADADGFRTPLGDVPVSPLARDLARRPPFALDPRCYVEPPDWVPIAERRGPGAMHAGTWEHSVEVEIPFLQRTLSHFSLVPVVMGDTDPAAAAQALAPLLREDTLLIASSDLSHYHPYTEARQLDERTVQAICSLDLKGMAGQEACGRVPILTLLHLAKQFGWQPKLLDVRNSGDTAGDKSRVVGYAAVAFYAATATELSASDQKQLLKLARDTVRAATVGQSTAMPPMKLSPALTTPRGVFVTLTRHGELRGCIGHLGAQRPLVDAVAENARSAALDDPRFQPVTPREVDGLEIEISVLTEPKPLAFTSPEDLLAKLRPKVDGVVLQVAAGTATYLPQVWDQLPDKTEFLDSLSEKAGGHAGDWRKPGVKLATYQVKSFKDDDR